VQVLERLTAARHATDCGDGAISVNIRPKSRNLPDRQGGKRGASVGNATEASQIGEIGIMTRHELNRSPGSEWSPNVAEVSARSGRVGWVATTRKETPYQRHTLPEFEIPPMNDRSPVAEHAKVQLIIERGEARNRVREITGPLYLIGTSDHADLVLGDSQFADYHAYICLRGNEVTLRHLGNLPEVTVNGRMVRWGELRDGDRLRMGPYQFRVALAPIPTATEELSEDELEAAPPTPAHHAERKRWSTHPASHEVAPMFAAWKGATTPAHVVGWFDAMKQT
jgi:hypothetical protein